MRLSIKSRSETGLHAAGLSTGSGTSYELSPDYCYAIHVTGDNPLLRRMKADVSCTQGPDGLGYIKGLYSKGDEVELEVPVGTKRRIDLLGLPKAHLPGNKCSKDFVVDPDSDGKEVVIRIDGQVVKVNPQLIATTTTDLKDGENVVDLIAAADTNAGVAYTCKGFAVDKLVFSTEASGAVAAGTEFSVQPVVKAFDSNGNLTARADLVTLVPYTDSLCQTPAALTAASLANSQIPAVNGVASFAHFQIFKAGTYYLKALSGSVASACSATSVQVSPGPLAQLALASAMPAGPFVRGSSLSAFDVVLQDAYGNLRPSDTSTVTLSAASNSDCSSATSDFSGSLTASPVNGLAHFPTAYIAASPNDARAVYFKATAAGVSYCSGPSNPMSIVASLSLSYAYNNGANWNDFVKYYTSSPTACSGADTGSPSTCINGGEYRRVDLPSAFGTSCIYRIADDLGVFDWICDSSMAPTKFISRLKPGKGLGDLIEPGSGVPGAAGAWRNNAVRMYDISTGQLVGVSPSGQWWSNSVVEAPDSSATTGNLSTVGTIYTFSNNRSTALKQSVGYQILADKVSFVAMPGAAVVASGVPASDGVVQTVSGTPVNFVWIEGGIDGATVADMGVRLDYAKWSTLRNVSVWRAKTSGLLMGTALYNRIMYSTIASTVGDTTTPTSWHAVQISGSNYNVFEGLKVYNNLATGIYVAGSTNNIFTRLLVTGNRGHGVEIDASATGTIVNSATMASNDAGLIMGYSGFEVDTAVVNNVLAIENHQQEIDLNLKSSKVGNLALTPGSTYGFKARNDSSYPNTFHGNILLSSGATCASTGSSTDVGVSTGCLAAGASANVVRSPSSLLNSIVGPVANGASVFANILGFAWVDFANPFRTWGLDGVLGSATNFFNGCSPTDTSCRTWDWSLKASDTILRNSTKVSASTSAANGAFVSGSTCPSEVDSNLGANVATGPSGDFLINAVEMLGDNLGNDNGLCESGEACIYTPNFGAYQGGHHDGTDTPGLCTLIAGPINNVQMFGYPASQNGF